MVRTAEAMRHRGNPSSYGNFPSTGTLRANIYSAQFMSLPTHYTSLKEKNQEENAKLFAKQDANQGKQNLPALTWFVFMGALW